MGFGSISGRARTSTTNPEAFGVCDRCGGWRNLNRLSFQYQWAGPQLQNTRLLVCRRCLDTPNEQLRTIVLPPDPLPVLNARPENWAVADD